MYNVSPKYWSKGVDKGNVLECRHIGNAVSSDVMLSVDAKPSGNDEFPLKISTYFS